MTLPLPRGFSALIDPDDELYLRILERCAHSRRRLGLPALERAELAALLERREPDPRAHGKVVPLARYRRMR